MNNFIGTHYPEVNTLVSVLLSNLRVVLGDDLIGLYLEGSLSTGGFDRDSDIDFVAVTKDKILPGCFEELRRLHERLARIDSPYAVQLEGTYISTAAILRYEPNLSWHPNIERGQGNGLEWWCADQTWDIHRFILREKGIVVYGPDPQTLIDPVSTSDLRRAVISLVNDWAKRILEKPESLNHRGYQAYVVLSLCRIMYTLHHGTIVSKRVAAYWVQTNSQERWYWLIERTWDGRHEPDSTTFPEDRVATIDFIRLALDMVAAIKS